jgi:hypothetical protein
LKTLNNNFPLGFGRKLNEKRIQLKLGQPVGRFEFTLATNK